MNERQTLPSLRQYYNLGCIFGLAVAAAAIPAVPVRGADLRDEVAERVTHATLYVKTFQSQRSQADTLRGTGTGFFINRTGLAITNNHVVDPTHGTPPWERERSHAEHYRGGKLAWRVVVDSGKDKEKEYEATVLYQNEAADQAVLQVFAADGEMLDTPDYLRLLPESRLRKYDETWVFGFPGGQKQASRGDTPEVQIEKGNIIDMPRTPASRLRMIYTDAIARPGNSGGPCVDRDGFMVGTVTLMKPPEGREDTGGARYSALVPSMLTAEMVRNAFLLGKIGEGTDFTPFMKSITQQGGLVNVPEFERRAQDDVLFFDNGDRYPGKVAAESIDWLSELGAFSIPVTNIAYLMRNDDGFGLYLEGGNRLTGEPKKETIRFETRGGKAVNVALDDVSVVAFRTDGHAVGPIKKETTVFDSDLARLTFDEIVGKPRISSRLGDWDLTVNDIERIDTDDGGEQVVSLKDGSRFTGELKPDKLRGTLAGMKTALEFQLVNVRSATFEVRVEESSRLGGLSMEALLKDAPQDLRDAWSSLAADPREAAERIAALADPKKIKRFSETDQDRVRLLDAMAKLRTGDPSGASRGFRSASKSDDVNVAAFALAHAEVLREYKDFKFDGKSLADSVTFAAAARALASVEIVEARTFLKGAFPPEIERKGEFRTLLNGVRRHERAMVAAAVIVGTEAEDIMIRLWKTAIEAGLQELDRLALEGMKASQQSGGRSNRGRGRYQVPGGDDGEKVVEALREYLIKQFDYGFHIADPDIDAIMARRR